MINLTELLSLSEIWRMGLTEWLTFRSTVSINNGDEINKPFIIETIHSPFRRYWNALLIELIFISTNQLVRLFKWAYLIANTLFVIRIIGKSFQKFSINLFFAIRFSKTKKNSTLSFSIQSKSFPPDGSTDKVTLIELTHFYFFWNGTSTMANPLINNALDE